MARSAKRAFTGVGVLLNGGMRNELRLAWRLLRDERVSSLKLILPALAVVYVVSPFDPVPDFLLGLGQVDDLGIVVVAAMVLARVLPWLAPSDVVDEHVRDINGWRDVSGLSATDTARVIDADFSMRG